MTQREISQMRMLCRAERASAGLFTLLEGHVARTVHVLGSIHVTEQVANRLGHRQVH